MEIESSPLKGAIYYEKVLNAAIAVGSGLLSSGCPVAKVELAMEYICKGCGAEDVNASVMPNMIFGSVKYAGGMESSQLKRVRSVSNNFSKMEAYNQLSRDISEHRCTVDEALTRAEEIEKKVYPGKLMTAISGGIAAGSFSIFYGGSLIDAIPAALIGALMAFLSHVLSGLAFNGYARTFILSLIGGVLCTFFSWLIRLTGIDCTLSTVMMGTIMIVIPGLLLTNAIRDLFAGDIYSGTFEALNAMLTTLAIVAGYGLAMTALKGIVGSSDVPARADVTGDLVYALMSRAFGVNASEYIYRIAACIIGTSAFTLFFGGEWRRLLPAEGNALISFVAYLILKATVKDELVCTLISTVIAAIIAEGFARGLKAPSTIFFVPGIIAFVPGRSLYMTFSTMISGDSEAAREWLSELGVILVGIVVGLTAVTLALQLIKPERFMKRKNK